MPTEKPQRANTRRHRLDGAASRARIVDAAAEIAAVRGYEAPVSPRSARNAAAGEFDLLAFQRQGRPDRRSYRAELRRMASKLAVARRGFATGPTGGHGDADRQALSDSPDFLRLGLMLSLERRPVEPRARSMFLEVRANAVDSVSRAIVDLVPGLTADQIRRLSTYAVAGADGLFIAKEIDGDALDLVAMFEQHALALYGLAERMASENSQ